MKQSVNFSSSSAGQRKIYRLRPGILLRPLFLMMGVYVLVSFVSLISKPQPGHTNNMGFVLLITGLIFLLVTVLATLFIGLSMRLVVMPEGLISYGGGFSVYTPWQNLVRGQKVRYGNQNVEGLVMRQAASQEMTIQEGIQRQTPVMEMSKILQVMITILPVLRVIAITQGRYVSSVNMKDYVHAIPIGLYTRDWHAGALGQELQAYAPQLS